MDGWVGGWMDGLMDRRVDEWNGRPVDRMDGWVDRWMDGWNFRWIVGKMHRGMNRSSIWDRQANI